MVQYDATATLRNPIQTSTSKQAFAWRSITIIHGKTLMNNLVARLFEILTNAWNTHLTDSSVQSRPDSSTSSTCVAPILCNFI